MVRRCDELECSDRDPIDGNDPALCFILPSTASALASSNNSIQACLSTSDSALNMKLRRGPNFSPVFSRRVFEGVQYHVLDLVRK